jgi:hypothetical protein
LRVNELGSFQAVIFGRLYDKFVDGKKSTHDSRDEEVVNCEGDGEEHSSKVREGNGQREMHRDARVLGHPIEHCCDTRGNNK